MAFYILSSRRLVTGVCVCVCVHVCVFMCYVSVHFSVPSLYLSIVSSVSLLLACASVDGSPTLHQASGLLGGEYRGSNGCAYIMHAFISLMHVVAVCPRGGWFAPTPVTSFLVETLIGDIDRDIPSIPAILIGLSVHALLGNHGNTMGEKLY